ncbi:MAG: hypothetical protein PHW02_06410 [bacterium]|nr:hypothetical protein [bacterium]
MKRNLFLLSFALLILAGCCKKVEVPAVIQMNRYEPVAMVNVVMTNSKGNLSSYATQRLIEFMTLEQKGNRILEIGDLDKVLGEVNAKEVNPDAIKAIGEKYKVKTVIISEINISDVQPQVKFNLEFPYISARAKISSEMTVRMYETELGATVWTGSSWAKDEVGNLSIFKDYVSFNAENPDEAYGDLVTALVDWATIDYRKTYECRD